MHGKEVLTTKHVNILTMEVTLNKLRNENEN